MKKPFDSNKKQRWTDHYSERAKKERYPARSVYKLKEAQQKYRLIRKGDRVLDLGCSPGSWLLYAAELTGKHGKVFGLDLMPVKIQIPRQAQTLEVDILTIDRSWVEKEGWASRFNAVLSDMAPATTGNKALDAARSFQLCQAALTIAEMVLKPGGTALYVYPAEPIKGVWAIPTAVILHNNPLKATTVHCNWLWPSRVRAKALADAAIPPPQ